MRQHFCSSQKPPCTRNECRVATQIIAGLYPLNFAKFLVLSYQPLNEDERKGLIHIHHIYLTYLIRKLCNDNSKTLGHYNMNDVLKDMDDSDYLLLCDIGSAFAECYLTDSPVPVLDALDACFECSGFDIELNMAWLDALYAEKEREAASGGATCAGGVRRNGCSGFEEDPMLRELKEIGAHMDKFFLDKTTLQKALIRQEDIIRMSNLTGDGAVFGFEQLATGLGDAGIVAAAVAQNKDEGGAVGGGVKSDHLAEAIKLAVNQKLNL